MYVKSSEILITCDVSKASKKKAIIRVKNNPKLHTTILNCLSHCSVEFVDSPAVHESSLSKAVHLENSTIVIPKEYPQVTIA